MILLNYEQRTKSIFQETVTLCHRSVKQPIIVFYETVIRKVPPPCTSLPSHLYLKLKFTKVVPPNTSTLSASLLKLPSYLYFKCKLTKVAALPVL